MVYYDPSGHVEVTYGDGGLPVQNETPAGEAVNKGGNNPCIYGAINNGQPLNDHRVVPNSEANKLPVTGVPNSSADLLNPDSSVIQRRYYGEDGKAQILIKMQDYGWPIVYLTEQELIDYIRTNEYKYIKINSSYGMDGWILARSYEIEE